MKIALAQLNYAVGSIESNKTKIIQHVGKAKENGADLVVFTEYSISGAPCYDLLKLRNFLDDCEEALVEIAAHCDGIAAIVGIPISYENKTISAAAIIEDRKIIRYVGKEHVISRDESPFVTPSKGCEYFKFRGKKFALVLGEDVLVENQYGEYADVVISIWSDPYARGIIANRYQWYRSFAFRTGKPVVFLNHLGGQTDIVYDGSSCAYNSHGEAACFMKSFEEDFVVLDLDRAPEVAEPEQFKTRNVFRAIKLGLKDYFKKNNFRKACIGLSGGIDSAVVLAMAVEALGAKNVKALIMPSQFSTDHSVEDAVEMAEGLGVAYDVIPITEAYKTISESLKPLLGGTKFDTTEENIQARIRAVIIMADCNKHGYIPLNTSNKSEIAVGYSTMYGDGIGAISVIGDLYKIEVYSLARYINREKEIIPNNILTKEPSAELRPGQKDSDSLPPYEVLDAILYRFIEEGQMKEELENAGFDPAVVQRVFNLIKASTYKRAQFCPILRLSPRDLGQGLKLPITNRYYL